LSAFRLQSARVRECALESKLLRRPRFVTLVEKPSDTRNQLSICSYGD